MIVFEKVKIQNFLSYGNNETEIKLQRDDPTLISGINYDASSNGELDSNGSGKSSILMAISVALYDKAIGIDNPKKNALINNINNKDMLVAVELKAGKKEYKIYRFRKNKAMGGDGVKIEENGKDITPDSVSNANKFIADHIMQIPFEIFGKIVAYAAGEDSFLKMPLATQRNIIEELFSYTELSNKADILKDKIKNNKKDLEYAKESNQDIKEEHSRHIKQLEEAKRDHAEWIESTQKKINDINDNIKALGEINFDLELESLRNLKNTQKELDDIRREVKSTADELERIQEETNKANSFESDKEKNITLKKNELSDYSISAKKLNEQKKIIESVEENETTLKDHKIKQKKLQSEYEEIDQSINDLSDEKKELEKSKCPYCLQDYEDAKRKLKDVESNIKSLGNSKNDLEKKLASFDENIKSVGESIEDLKSSLEFSSLVEIERYVTKKNQLKKDIKSLEESNNPYEDKSDEIDHLTNLLDNLRDKEKGKKEKFNNIKEECLFTSEEELFKMKNKKSGLEDKLKYLEEQNNPYDKVLKSLSKYEPKKGKDDEINTLIEDIKHQEFLLKLLTKKDSFIRKALMDKYLPFLNKRLKNYLNLMGLPHKAKFTSDLSTEISQFGNEISYSNLSSGQKARINIALSLAFRDVLQSKHNFINLFILDECLDVGLSNVGVKKTLKVIKDVAKNNKLSMFVISHRDEIKSSFNERVEIELKNGFSNVVEK